MVEEDPERPSSLVVRGPERVDVDVWKYTSPDEDIMCGELSWDHLLGHGSGTEDIERLLKVEVHDNDNPDDDNPDNDNPENDNPDNDNPSEHTLSLFCDPTARVLYTFAYYGVPPELSYRRLANYMMEAWRQVQTDDPAPLIRKIFVPIGVSPSVAREFISALGSPDNINPTGRSEWRTLPSRENSPMFTNVMETSLGRTITEAATHYRRQIVRPAQNRCPAEVKSIQVLLAAPGIWETVLPVEAVIFVFE